LRINSIKTSVQSTSAAGNASRLVTFATMDGGTITANPIALGNTSTSARLTTYATLVGGRNTPNSIALASASAGVHRRRPRETELRHFGPSLAA